LREFEHRLCLGLLLVDHENARWPRRALRCRSRRRCAECQKERGEAEGPRSQSV